MKDCRVPIRFTILLAGQLLSGCAATHQHAVIKPMARAPEGTSRVLVEVKPGPALPEEATRLAHEVVSKLNAASRFAQVDVKDDLQPQADLLVSCKITHVNRVSGGERAILGAMAGQASMQVNVRLVRSSTGDVIGEANVIGNSSGGTIFAGTTPQAIDQAAAGIVKFITSS